MGPITFRIGATARNLPGIELEAHVHAGLWRIDVDLGGATRNSVLITSHQELAGSPVAADDNVGPSTAATRDSRTGRPKRSRKSGS